MRLLLILIASTAFGQVATLPSTHLTSVAYPNQGTNSAVPAAWANYGFTTYVSYVVQQWGGAIADTKRSRLIVWGGGHNASYDNSVFALHLLSTDPCGGTAAPCWERLTDPSVWDYSSGCATTPINYCDANPDGTATSRHTYFGLVDLPNQDAMFSLGGGLAPQGGDSFKFWRFDLSAKTWGQRTLCTGGSCSMSGITVTGQSVATAFSTSTGGSGDDCAYDSVSNTVWCHPIANSGDLVQYDPGSDTLLGRNHSLPSGYGFSLSVDTARRRLYFLGGAKMGYVDISGADATYSFVDITSVISGCSTISGNWPGLDYDPVLSRFVAIASAGYTALTIFDPGTNTCVSAPLSGATIASGNDQGFTFGRFRYFPALGKYVLVNDTDHDAYTIALNATAIPGLGSSTLTCLDVDGDGYGVGPGCTGPDADDNDSAVHTAAQAVTKYGTLAAFINHLGYNPTRLWYLAASGGNDSTCAVGTLASPPSVACATWAHFAASVVAGDMVMLRGGTYSAGFTMAPISGTSGVPTIFMSYPGELPFIDNRATTQAIAIDLSAHNYIVVDGIKAAGGLGNSGCIGGGGGTNIVIRHTETLECTDGGIDAFNIVDWTIEYNLMHAFDSGICGSCQHSMYIGAHASPSSNVFVRRNIMYGPNSGYPAFQWNGRGTNIVVEQNMVYGTPGGVGISILEGMSNSRITENLVFNNGGGILFGNYPGDCLIGTGSGGVCPYDQTGNLVANNTVYVGNDPGTGLQSTGNALYVSNNSTGCPDPVGLGAGWTPSTLFVTGRKVLDPSSHTQLATTGGTSGSGPTWNDSGGTTTDGSITWTDQGLCTPAKQGNLGGNTFRNNLFSVQGAPVLYKSCTLATFNSTCALDTGETYLATSVFQNNLFQSYAGGAPTSIVFTAPGASFTGHDLAALNGGLWAASSTSNINADPKYVAASTAYWNTPALFNLRLLSNSTAIGSGTPVSTPTFDVIGNNNSITVPNMGSFSGIGGFNAGGTLFGGKILTGGRVIK